MDLHGRLLVPKRMTYEESSVWPYSVDTCGTSSMPVLYVLDVGVRYMSSKAGMYSMYRMYSVLYSVLKGL